MDGVITRRVLWQLDVSISNEWGELNLISGSGSCTLDGVSFTEDVIEIAMLDWVLEQLDEKPDPWDVELVRFVWLFDPEEL